MILLCFIFNHAFFKALLFKCWILLFIVFLGEQDLRQMGGLSVITTRIFQFYADVFAHWIPFTTGFYSKMEYLIILFIIYWMLHYCIHFSTISAFLTANYTSINLSNFYFKSRFLRVTNKYSWCTLSMAFPNYIIICSIFVAIMYVIFYRSWFKFLACQFLFYQNISLHLGAYTCLY
jgi:hypothetical protein